MSTNELNKIIRVIELILKKTLDRPDIEIMVQWTPEEIECLMSGEETYEDGKESA